MDLYRKALGTYDLEIQFLYYYKIIEYYSPIAAKRSAYEGLSSKLDSLKYKDIDNQDLTSIFTIAEKYRIALSDKELAQTMLTVVDIVDLFPRLPENIKKRIAKLFGIKLSEFGYGTKPETTRNVSNQIGAILYSTRNSIVHAKSNYKSDSNECDEKDLPELNNFLKETCYLIITWHSKLPKHLRYN